MFKTVSLALAAIAASATIASADVNYINSFVAAQDSQTHIELGLVRAEAAGVVEIYDFQTGEAGELLGSTNVHAGVNPNVNLNIGITGGGTDALAVLKVGGQIVDTQKIDFK